ncbi:657_t:CDS:2, partial [Cetraspora pellucida]
EKKTLKDELKKIIIKYQGEANVFGNFETEEEVDQTPADTTNADKLDANEVNSIKLGFAHFFVQKVLENKTKNNADKKKMIDEYFEAYNELSKVDKLAKERQDLKNELQAIIDDYQGKGIVKGNFEDELNEYNK